MGRGRRPQKSIPGINDPRASTFLEDWAVVVNQFCPLRRIPSVKIYIPERSDLGTAANPKIQQTISIQELMTCQEPFGTYLNEEDEWRISDTETRETLDIIFGQLDRELDYTRGPTANVMRLERFSAWYDSEIYGKSTYLDELERVYGSVGYILEDLNPWYLIELKEKYRLMAAFNPLSFKMQKMRFEEHQYEHSLTPSHLDSEFPGCQLWTKWDWRQYTSSKKVYSKFKI